MTKTVLTEGDEGVSLIIREPKHRSKRSAKSAAVVNTGRSPVHVVYGGADRYKPDTPSKLGKIALATLETYLPNEKVFAKVFEINQNAAAVYQRTKAKLIEEPVEDLRIDFEDGYGSRPDAEEDSDAERCAKDLAAAFADGIITPFSGFRIRSYSNETRDRARRTLNIFLDEFLDRTKGKLPQNFVVTLPKITDKKEVSGLCRDLKKIEKMARLREGSISIEIMVEHPLTLINKKGSFGLREIVESSRGRCVAAHFGAYDHTAVLGIAASHQDITHPACDFARQVTLAALTPIGIRLSDSVTPQIPVPIHRADKLAAKQKEENKQAVASGLKKHFDNVLRSMSQGFYQSWDLHPNQLIARYAAVYSFYFTAVEAQGERLRGFIEKAAKATLTGNAFDDAATALGLVNFFRRGIACSAVTEEELKKATGLSIAQLHNIQFNR